MFQRTVIPVLGHPAEPGHNAIVEVLEQDLDVAHGRRNVKVQGLDLQSVNRDDGMAIVHQVVCQGEPGGAEAHDQDLPAAIGAGQGTPDVQRVPARQQGIDLEAPRQLQHILQHGGLGLWNIDRLLLLVDTGLHAVIANAMAGRRHHRVVDGDHREGAQHMTCGAQRMHLGNFLVERTAGEGDAEHRLLKLSGLAVLQPGRAGVLPLGMAPDAVIHLVQSLLGVHPMISKGKALAVAPVMLRQTQHRDAVALDCLDRHEVLGIDPARHVEKRAAAMMRLPFRRQGRPGGITEGFVQRRWVVFRGDDLGGEGFVS